MFSPQLNVDFPCEHLNQSFFSDLRLLKKCVTDVIQLTDRGASNSNIYCIKTENGGKYFLKLFITEVPSKIKSLKNYVRPIDEIEGETKDETSQNFIQSMMEKPKLKSYCLNDKK